MEDIIDYSQEPHDDILCIDVKSFYASVECVERGYNPLTKMLVVMSNAENAGGLILAASPMAKKQLGLSNVMRKFDLPNHPDLEIVPPRMALYIEKNKEIIAIFRRFATEEDILIYSIDEAFLKVNPVKKLFKTDAYGIARLIQQSIYKELGFYTTVGIGDNPLLAKLALDNEAKDASDFKAEWRYEDVSRKIWQLHQLTDMWGIGHRTEKQLQRMGIQSVYDLAHHDYQTLKLRLGKIGEQLYAHAWGIDRSNISQKYHSLEKSYGNSQILTKDYTVRTEIEVVIREMADQVAARLRRHHCQTECVQLFIGYASDTSEKGFNRQLKISATNHSKELIQHCLFLFQKYYRNQSVRQIGISYSKLRYSTDVQLDLFQEPDNQIAQIKLDSLVDTIRTKFGYTALVHASSLTSGATAIARSTLVGGHASGIAQKEEKQHGTKIQP